MSASTCNLNYYARQQVDPTMRAMPLLVIVLSKIDLGQFWHFRLQTEPSQVRYCMFGSFLNLYHLISFRTLKWMMNATKATGNGSV